MSYRLTILMPPVRKHHPDRPGGSNEAFQFINEAREVLTNEEAKATYDKAYRPRLRLPAQPPLPAQSGEPSPASPPMADFQPPSAESWKITKKNPYEQVLKRVHEYYARLSVDQEARNLTWGIKMAGLDTRPRFVSRHAHRLNSKVSFVPIVRRGDDGTMESKDVKFEEVVDSCRDGWDVPACPGRATNPSTDREVRQVSRQDDTPDRQMPWNPHHLQRYFAKAIRLMKAAGVEYTHGQFFGKTPSGCHDENNISRSKKFLPPQHTCGDIRSATSHGHSITYPRPVGVGAGWGGYDEVYEWQACGRAVDKSMPEPLNWSEKVTTTFVSIDNPRVVVASLAGFDIRPQVEDDDDDDEAPKPKSLWRKFQESGRSSFKDKAALDALEQSLPLPGMKGR